MKLRIDNILKHKAKVFLILLLLGFIAYANVLQGPFLFDDEHFIEKNVMIQSLKNIPDIYNSSVTEGAAIEGNLYRPNQQMMYALLYSGFGLNPIPFHLLSILLHICNAFLLFLLLTRIKFSRVAAFMAAILFLLHPVQTEAISYISGLADPLGFCFMLLGLNFFIYYLIRKPALYILLLSVLFFVLAMFTKENQVVFLPISVLLFIYLHATKQIVWSFKQLNLIALFVLLAGGYVYLKLFVFNFGESMGLTNAENVYTDNLHIRLYTFASVLWDYAKLIVFPWDLHYEKPYTAYATIMSWRAAFGILWMLLFLLSFIYVKKVPRLFLGLGCFFTALLPFTGIIPLNAMYLEHWLYIPLAGMGILLASLYDLLKSEQARKLFVLVFVIVMILFGVRCIMRNSEWTDIEKFYLNELEYTDQSIRIYNNLGMYYSAHNNSTKAEQYYRRSIAIADHFPQPHHNLANMYARQGDTTKTLQELYFALQIDPQFVYSLRELYQIYTARGETAKAIDVYALYMNAAEGKKNDPIAIQQIMAK